MSSKEESIHQLIFTSQGGVNEIVNLSAQANKLGISDNDIKEEFKKNFINLLMSVPRKRNDKEMERLFRVATLLGMPQYNFKEIFKEYFKEQVIAAIHDDTVERIQGLLIGMGNLGMSYEDIIDPHRKHNDTPLHLATTLRRTHIVNLLIEGGAWINIRNEGYDTPLHIACRQNDSATVALLLSYKRTEVDASNFRHETPLIIAINNGYSNIVKLLCAANADIFDGHGYSITPLSWAIAPELSNREKIISILLVGDDNIDYTLLFHKVIHMYFPEDSARIQRLLAHEFASNGAKVNELDAKGNTLLHANIYNGRTHIVELLIRCGADINVRDARGYTPLHWAVFYGRMEMFDLLLSNANIDVTVAGGNGQTPLDMAIERNEEEMSSRLRALRPSTSPLLAYGTFASSKENVQTINEDPSLALDAWAPRIVYRKEDRCCSCVLS